MQLVGEGVAAIDLGFPVPLHAFGAGGLRPRRPRRADAAAGRGHRGGSTPDFSLDRDDLSAMRHYLGIDIGTFESKGVLVDDDGPDRRAGGAAAQDAGAAAGLGRAPAARGLVGRLHLHLARSCSPTAGSRRRTSAPSAASAIGPCMLPVDADGEALMNARALWRRYARRDGDRGADGARSARTRCSTRCGNALTSQSVGPEDPLAEAQPAGDLTPRPRRSSPRPPTRRRS